ncbi:MAG TPA: Calx-beta domain-containing protein [Vicinamibacterales bacterium]
MISAKSGDSITVNAQAVVVPLNCVIRHGNTQFTFADLHVGDRVHVKGTRTTTGVGALAVSTIEATEVKLQNPGGGDDGEEEPTALVSVAAFDSIASETGANTGTFRLTRAGSAALLASPLTVTFSLTGTATNTTDYQNLPTTATFAANQATVDVVVTPVADGATESAESVILTLTSVAPYDLGSPIAATVTITDTDSPLVSVSAFDSTASETGPDMGTFRFARTGSVTASLTVTFTVTGMAVNGTDYQSVPLTVTFAIGEATKDLFVVPLTDADAEGSETVIVTVTDGATYDVGAPAMATVTIAG